MNMYRTDCPHEIRLKRRKIKRMVRIKQSSSSQMEEVEDDELVIILSDSVHEMYPEWTMYWEVSLHRYHSDGHTDSNAESETEGLYGILNEPVVKPESDPVEWKTIIVGKTRDIQSWLERNSVVEDTLGFEVSWSLSSLNKTQRELDGLKKAMMQTHSTLLESFKQPSVDLTQLIFRSKRNGRVKRLYVPTSVLTQFEYFQGCHSTEYAESQNVDRSCLQMPETPKLDERLYSDDSDYGWDSDSDDPEPPKNAKFKATIHITDTADFNQSSSTQTSDSSSPFRIRALYFSPRQSDFQEYYDQFLDPDWYGPGSFFGEAESRGTPWPQWAQTCCTPHTVVPGFKTLASARSLYRLADMLIIPELNAICLKQIMNDLGVDKVMSELKTSVFEEHEELRVEVYKFMRQHWRSFDSSQIIPFITSLSPEEGVLVFDHILKYVQ
ncbi:hypothetical protein DFH28DRAFT_895392 [Melampsora americana]|nr:hypothetical protein DFH28DRAFT_895392 [Melampsora americana]